MYELTVKVNEKIVKVNVIRVFRSQNPFTNQYNVNLMLEKSRKGVWLFFENQEEADTLVQKIRDGEITDLTEYKAMWG